MTVKSDGGFGVVIQASDAPDSSLPSLQRSRTVDVAVG
jgi:hypothetical protein